jgi:DNA-binding beta-propeller fold protein YncE
MQGSSNPISPTTTKQQSSIHCAPCLEEYEEAIRFCSCCKLPLCNDDVELNQKAKEVKDNCLMPVEQASNDQQYGSIEHREIESLFETPNKEQSLSNVLQKHSCLVCHHQLSKRAKTSNDDLLLFCSEQCLEHYNNRGMNQRLDLSLIPEGPIDDILMPLIDAKVLHYLKCTDSTWRRKIEEYIENSTPMFKFKTKFGSGGSGNGQFNGPLFVTTDKQGDIYVSDRNNHRIQVFDSNQQWKKSIGSYGSENGQFNGPIGITFNSKNHMFVADCYNRRIQEFGENMQFIKAFGSNGNALLKYPSGIAVDADDNIVVVDNDNHRIQMFSKDGNWKRTIGKQGSGAGEFIYPWDVAICKTDGRIFVSDNWKHRIQVFSPDGKFLFKFGSKGSENGQFQYPRGLTLSNCGKYLLVCDYYNHRIQVFNAMNGTFCKSYGLNGSGDGQLENPNGICISPSGQIIVSEVKYKNYQQHIQIFE